MGTAGREVRSRHFLPLDGRKNFQYFALTDAKLLPGFSVEQTIDLTTLDRWTFSLDRPDRLMTSSTLGGLTLDSLPGFHHSHD